MTLETYEKATELRIQINHMHDILCTIKNSKGKYLAAAKLDADSDTGFSIVNNVHIMDEPIIQKLADVVEAEIRHLEDEFRRL